MTKPGLSVVEAAELSGFCQMTLRRCIAKGLLPVTFVGGTCRVMPVDLAAMLRAHRVPVPWKLQQTCPGPFQER